ncbi:MAG: GntR family transcriptional regulator [Hyphomicrobiaceae bacterium]
MALATNKPNVQPLYEQVREILLERIQSGFWVPGQALPNEFEIAAELGVSQGTVRKALGVLAAEQLLVRRQGRGTFVAEHTSAEVLFRFFQFYDPAGNRVSPQSRSRRTRRGKVRSEEAKKLGLAADARVIRHARVRTIADRPFLRETIVLPEARFAGLGIGEEIPNTLYDLFQREYGITVSRADEQLTAVAATEPDAKTLGIAPGTPLLRIDRVTYAIDETPIEWRVSICHLRDIHYAVRLR